jgi:hypothetical protein
MDGHLRQPANVPLKQTTLVNVRVSVTPTPDGGAILSFDLPGEQVVVPLVVPARNGTLN